jgi:hypothetical protein
MVLFTLYYCICPKHKNIKKSNYKTYVDDEPLSYRVGQPGVKIQV